MINSLLFIGSLIFIYVISSSVVNRFATSVAYKRLCFSLLLYLVPSLVILISGFTSLLNPLFVFSLLFIIMISSKFLCRKPGLYKHGELSNISLELFPEDILFLLLIIFYFLKVSLGAVWISLDDSTYHAAVPARWVQDGTFFVKQLTYQGSFPFNGSLFSTFFLLFLKTEHLSAISELLLIYITFCSMTFLIDKCDVNKKLLFLIPFVFFVPDIEKYLMGFSDSDVSPGVLLFASYCLLQSDEKSIFKFILSGFLLGFTVGTKLTNLFFCLPVLYELVRRNISQKRYIAMSLLAASTIASPWYLKNLIEYGNPIFPFTKFGLEGILSSEVINMTSLKSMWRTFDVSMRLLVFKGFLGWQPFSSIFGIGVVSTLLISIFDNKNKNKFFSFTCLITFGLFVFIFLGSPFSGLNESFGLNVNSSRYLLPLYIPAFFISCSNSPVINNILNKHDGKFFFILIALFSIIGRYNNTKIWLSLGVTALVLMFFYFRKFKAIKFNFLLLVLVSSHMIYFYAIKKNKISTEKSVWYSSYVNNLEPPKKITLLNGFIFRSYYLFGKELKNKPVRVGLFGSAKPDLSNKIVRKNYIYPSYLPDLPKNFCDMFVSNIKNTDLDIIIINKSVFTESTYLKCDELYEYFTLDIDNKKGQILVKL